MQYLFKNILQIHSNTGDGINMHLKLELNYQIWNLFNFIPTSLMIENKYKLDSEKAEVRVDIY